jgi:pimeloyl-ACP methyl ester carboxylesterase
LPNITVNGVQLYFEDTGKGKPIVFLHGYVGDIEDWRNQIRLLSPQYRCLALDQRGRGKGVAPKKREDYTFDLFIDDVYRWLKQIKVEQFVLNGHSMGGMISQGFTLAHPEMVTGLVLAATSSGSGTPEAGEAKHREKLAEIALTQGTVAAFDYDLENNPGTKARYAKHPETLSRMREKTRTTSPEGYVYARGASNNRPVYTDRLGEIKCPTLAIVGDDDPLVAPMKVIAAKIPQCDFALVTNSGHGVMYEQPGQYNDALVKFVKKIKY